LLAVTVGDTVTINGLTYTAVSGTKADNTEFDIDGTDTADALDLVDSINNDTRVGTESLGLSATSSVGVVTITADLVGPAGNSITLAETGTTITISGANLANGADGTSAPYDLKRDTPGITAIRIRAKETSGGSPGTLRGDVRAF